MSTLLEEKAAIRELLAIYCFAIDRGQAEVFAGLFTADGSWDGPWGHCQGRGALLEFMQGVAADETKFRHLVMNEHISVAGDTASARSYLLILDSTQSPPKTFFTGFYDDRLVQSAGQWLFASRTVCEKPLGPIDGRGET